MIKKRIFQYQTLLYVLQNPCNQGFVKMGHFFGKVYIKLTILISLANYSKVLYFLS